MSDTMAYCSISFLITRCSAVAQNDVRNMDFGLLGTVVLQLGQSELFLAALKKLLAVLLPNTNLQRLQHRQLTHGSSGNIQRVADVADGREQYDICVLAQNAVLSRGDKDSGGAALSGIIQAVAGGFGGAVIADADDHVSRL